MSIVSELYDEISQLRAELSALKAGEGEAVEVVAWRSERYICGESHYSPPRLTFEQPYSTDRNCEPLMTVAQHKRIVAAITAPPASADARLVPLTREAIHLAFEHKLRAVNQPHYGERRGDWRTLNREELADVVLELLAAPSTKKESGDE